jgi:hypothetical protein
MEMDFLLASRMHFSYCAKESRSFFMQAAILHAILGQFM